MGFVQKGGGGLDESIMLPITDLECNQFYENTYDWNSAILLCPHESFIMYQFLCFCAIDVAGIRNQIKKLADPWPPSSKTSSIIKT